MNELALFAGAGGGLLGSHLLGWNTVCAVEREPYCQQVLLQRQLDGMLDRFPIWDDVCTFDGRPWRGHVDIVTGGFPCQDISSAGKGAGLAGARSGLWFEMLRIIGEAQPRFVLAENSPNLRTRGLGTILEGLTSLGYDVRWGVLGAWHVGAPHKRNRMWIAAANAFKYERVTGGEHVRTSVVNVAEAWPPGIRPFEPTISRVADGLAHRVDRIRAVGNGQVPAVAALAWSILSDGWI